MKRSSINSFLMATGLLLFLVSCGGGQQEAPPAPEPVVEEVAAPAPVVNTIVTTPENMMMVMHKVADYDKWKVAYDAHDSMRLANGVHSYVLGRGVKDADMVMVAVKVDDIVKGKAFAKDPGLKSAMDKSGVKGKPAISFIKTVYQDTVANTDIRSLSTFTVKDWDVWLKSFEDGKQERIDHGIAVRVVGHDVDDNKKVSIVTALADTAKAFAYYKSDQLKQRRIAGGLTSEPQRFLFKITHRY